MNADQILLELELLKDYTNDHGKQVLEVLKSELKPYLSAPREVEKIVEREKYVKQEIVAPGDRRSEVRDPMEHEQHVAEDLGLTRK